MERSLIQKSKVAAEVLYTAQLTKDTYSAEENVRKLINSKTPHSKRLRALVNLGGLIVPYFEEAIAFMLGDVNSLPVQNRLSPIGLGGEATVFLDKKEERVLKVYRRHMGGDTKKLVSEAQSMRDMHMAILQRFGEMPEIVQPESFFVGRSHIFGVGAVMSVQKYENGDLKDLFRDLSEQEAKALLDDNNCLKNQVSFVSQKVREQLDSEGRSIDVLGYRNLVVVDSARLALLDARGVFDHFTLPPNDPMKKIERTRESLDYMDKLVCA